MGLGAAPRRLILLACCLLPVALINTFFVWPKLLAAGYLLGVFALLFCHRPATDTQERAAGILIGGLHGARDAQPWLERVRADRSSP